MYSLGFHSSLIGSKKTSGYHIALNHILKSFKLLNLELKFNEKCKVNFHYGMPTDYKITGGYNIGYFFWETSIVPKLWAHHINKLDEVWAPCLSTKIAIRKSGYDGPIKIVPVPCEVDIPNKKVVITNESGDGFLENNFIFYSIFQWHYRKGWDCLLKAYYDSFSYYDDVALYIKSSCLGYDGLSKSKIYENINDIKSKYFKKMPKVIVNTSKAKYSDIMMVHKAGNCYVCTSRGEGWCLPAHEASIFDNTIISTKCGGFSESLNFENSYLCDHELSNVKNMNWSGNLYSKDQYWIEPDIDSISDNMMSVFNNHPKNLSCFETGNYLNYLNISKIIKKNLLCLKFQ